MTNKITLSSPIARLGIGPMSREIISSVYHYSHGREKPLMLIASKNQVDHDRGYVMTTSELRDYGDRLKNIYPRANVHLCRDHCGPGFNGLQDLKDVYRTIDVDMAEGFSLIHVDMCHLAGSYEERLEQSRQAIVYIQQKSQTTMIEIGTDENNGEDFEDLNKINREMSYFTSFCEPQFFVSQTGSLIKEIQQAGSFHEAYIDQVKVLADKYHLHLKEHNADYLPADEIKRRQGRIGAVNVAPQYGVMQTMFTLHKALTYGIDVQPFLAEAYAGGKWQKWLHTATAANKQLCAIIAGHYVFKTSIYQGLVEAINKHENFAESFERELFANFDMYLENLAAVPTKVMAASTATVK